MKSIFCIAMLTLTLLCGCATNPTGTVTPLQAHINQDVQAATIPDLQHALAEAQATNDVDGASCWQASLSWLQALPTKATTEGVPQGAGIASAIQAGRNLQRAGNGTFTPQIPDELRRACAVVILDAKTVAAKLGLTAAAAAKGLAIP